MPVPTTKAFSETRCHQLLGAFFDAHTTLAVIAGRIYQWDTLLFFYGLVLCVGGLGFIDYSAIALGYAATIAMHMLCSTARVLTRIFHERRGFEVGGTA